MYNIIGIGLLLVLTWILHGGMGGSGIFIHLILNITILDIL